jgi:hypothetical protein
MAEICSALQDRDFLEARISCRTIQGKYQLRATSDAAKTIQTTEKGSA